MPQSPIRKLMPYADKAKAEGVKVYHLNIGQPDVPTPDTFWNAVKNPGIDVVAYSHSAGILELRQKIAAAYCEMGIQVKTEEVLVTTSGSEALSFAIGIICDAGDEVIVPEPLYANYLGFAAGNGVNIVPIQTKIENDFALPGPEEFAKRVTEKTKAIIVCNPGNPTGTIYSRDQLEALREIALQHGIYLISDEVYREFVYEGGRPTSILELDGLDDNAVMVDSVSKRYSLCGARIGFIVSRNKEIMSAALRFGQARLSSPTLEMIGVIGALDTPASYFDDVRAEYKSRRDLLVSRLRAMTGVECPNIQGAFYAMVRFPIDDADRFCQWLLEEFRHENQTVMLAPGSGFYSTPGAGKNEARVAYVLNCQDLAKALDCLEQALAVYPGRVEPATAR